MANENLSKYLEELKEDVPTLMVPSGDGLTQTNKNLNKQIAQMVVRNTMHILNTINNCTIEDAPSVINEIAIAEMAQYRKAE